MSILNLTQHTATPEQIAAGVVEPDQEAKATIKRVLTFDKLPSVRDLEIASETLAQFAHAAGYKSAMIGGAPFFMPYLEKELLRWNVRPLYAFSVRESVEEIQEDGSVVKRNVFRHLGFVGEEFAEVSRQTLSPDSFVR